MVQGQGARSAEAYVAEAPESMVAQEVPDVQQKTVICVSQISCSKQSSLTNGQDDISAPRNSPQFPQPSSITVQGVKQASPLSYPLDSSSTYARTSKKRKGSDLHTKTPRKKTKDTSSALQIGFNETQSASAYEPSDSQVKKRDLEETISEIQTQLEIVMEILQESLEKQMEDGKTLTKGTRDNLKRLMKHIHEPNTFNKRLRDDLRVTTRTSEKLRKWVQQIVKGADANLNVTFPTPPDSTLVESTWESTMNRLRCIAGLRDKEPEYLPIPESAGYLTGRIEDILTHGRTKQELENFVEDAREHLQSPYAVQALISALFCCDLFQSPEPMCEPPSRSLMANYDMQRSISKSHIQEYSTSMTIDFKQKILRQCSIWTCSLSK